MLTRDGRPRARGKAAQPLRPAQIRVPDVRRPSIATAAKKQSSGDAQSGRVNADQAFIDAVSEESGALEWPEFANAGDAELEW